MIYQVAVQGLIDDKLAHWLKGNGVQIEYSDAGEKITAVTIQVPDQAALRGFLNKLWDLNLTLVYVRSGAVEPTKSNSV